ncbi:glutamate-5-semialdehyde dehydrogenase [Gracilinema caldarium]|uniref:Gamma-glutamyl phosphate reductase n=1 Tax=Gracilinema caldarium (strain ATCC 51460 / DSM 7334 / H1) TaxID=744872 RepID=F8F0D0_GRAC1|nr:glutamate-5-semialdehyde dehydrogenase [Gracilinema caldarium]AEJ18994.1 Gamma-glutamyl phosphate reductase [Gracilinema caldarium DSM 7334]
MGNLTGVFTILREAQKQLALAGRKEKDEGLQAVMNAIDEDREAILAANKQDVERARASGMKEALVDRLALNDKRINEMIAGVEVVLRQEDPIGRVLDGWTLPNGLFIEKVTVPLGTCAIIYESRPNVTVDAFCLAYKAGCSILLRGSSAALESNRALVASIRRALASVNRFPDTVALADSGSRDEVDEILSARGLVDVVIPRGGRDLIRRVVDNARVPVIETGEGNCHIYVEPSADFQNAVDIVENAKIQKPGACNAVETLLVHRDAAEVFIPLVAQRLAGRVLLRCCDRSRAVLEKAQNIPSSLKIEPATEADWATEYLDYILAVKVVDSLDEAITHINRYGTKHSEAILTNDLAASQEFEKRVDAACAYTNASIRFTDGGQFGFGAELGISTQKFHARGPMGLEALTTIKYRVRGTGQIRE